MINSSIKKYLKAMINIMWAMVVVIITIWIVPKVLIFFAPFVIGWIIATIATPPVRFLETKLKIRRKASSAFVVIFVIGFVILIGYLAGSKLVIECVELVEEWPQISEEWQQDLEDIGENLNVIYERFPKNIQETLSNLGSKIEKIAMDVIKNASAPTITAAGNFVKQVPAVIVGIIMCLLSAYFFVADREMVNIWWRKCMPQSIQKGYRLLKNSLFVSVGGYFKAQFKIEIWMFLIVSIGLAILGVEYVLPIALVISLLDFFPVFGTGTVMIPWAIIKFLSSDYKMTIGLLIIWGGGQLLRQIIQPKIVGDSIGVPPIPTLFLLFIGYKVGSVWGLILSVPIGMIFYQLYKAGIFDTTKYSIQILLHGINSFRKLTPQDMKVLKTDTMDTDSEKITKNFMTKEVNNEKEENKSESNSI